ncbi:hypothetical protein ACH4ND_17100 [Streptomyces sp. NPDC017179]|uniref:hypothetical protein n=1 Tax=Streptomyces sp. NPDC017179 TaxID=3364979 RepID=UPI003792F54E
MLRTASARADADKKYGNAQHAWIRCVRSKGYRAPNPTALMRQALLPYTKRNTDKAVTRRHEIAMAVTAAECNVETGLSASHDQAKQHSIDRLVGLNLDAYTQYRNTAAAALARARRVVADQAAAP